MTKIRRILIVKLSSIGDVVHALPVSAALKESFPHVELTWIVERMSAPMVEGNPYLKEVIILPPDWRKNRLSPRSTRNFLALRRDLHARRFDMAIDLQGLSKSAVVAWASGARYRYGYDWLRELAPRVLTRIPRRPESLHVIDQFLDVARFLGARVDKVKFPLHIPPEEAEAAHVLLCEAGVDPKKPYMVINPSAGGGGHKGWAPDRFAELVDEMGRDPGLPTVIVGSKDDVEVTGQIVSATSGTPANLVGRTNLKQLAAILHDCSLHVCGDTGSAHIGAALGTPVVSIFGRSNPDRLAPYGQERFAVHHRELCAAPCRHFHETASINSKQNCLAPPPVCLASVTVEEVLTTAKTALAEGRTGAAPVAD